MGQRVLCMSAILWEELAGLSLAACLNQGRSSGVNSGDAKTMLPVNQAWISIVIGLIAIVFITLTFVHTFKTDCCY